MRFNVHGHFFLLLFLSDLSKKLTKVLISQHLIDQQENYIKNDFIMMQI